MTHQLMRVVVVLLLFLYHQPTTKGNDHVHLNVKILHLLRLPLLNLQLKRFPSVSPVSVQKKLQRGKENKTEWQHLNIELNRGVLSRLLYRRFLNSLTVMHFSVSNQNVWIKKSKVSKYCCSHSLECQLNLS